MTENDDGCRMKANLIGILCLNNQHMRTAGRSSCKCLYAQEQQIIETSGAFKLKALSGNSFNVEACLIRNLLDGNTAPVLQISLSP